MWALAISPLLHAHRRQACMGSTTTERIQSSFVVRLNTVTTAEQNNVQPASRCVTQWLSKGTASVVCVDMPSTECNSGTTQKSVCNKLKYMYLTVCSIFKYLNVTSLSMLRSNTSVCYMQIPKYVTFKQLSTLQAIVCT